MNETKVVKNITVGSITDIKFVRSMINSGEADEIVIDFEATVDGIYAESLYGTVTVTKDGYASSRFPGEFSKWKS